MDPLSVAANIVAVLGFSLQSCGYIVTFIEKIADAPAEVQHNVVWLQALHATFSELHKLGTDARFRDAQVELPSGFKERLEDCQADLLRMELRVRGISQNLKGGRLLQTWAKVKYSFTGDHLLTKFSRQLQMYQTTFTLDLMTIQIKLTVLINSTRICEQPPAHEIEKPPKETRSLCTSGNQLTRFLDSSVEPISVRASTWYNLETYLGTFAWWSGPTMRRRWSNRRPVYDVTSVESEYGFGLQVYIGKRNGRKGISLRFALMKYPQQSRSVSIRWNISFPQVITRDSDIFEFVRRGNLAAVKSMFSMRRATPLNISPDGTGLLHVAAESGSFELVRFLLQEGAEVNARDEEGQTPLHHALRRSLSYDICRILLEQGADLGSRDVAGKTPLHTFFSPVVGRTLTNFREAIDEEIMTPDSSGMTILQYAAWSNRSGPMHLIPLLQSGEIYPFLARDNEGRSILHFAAYRGNIAILKYILSLLHDVGLGARDTNGQSTLHYAVHSKRTRAIDLLVSKGADLKAVDKRGRTVLHCAAARNNLAAIKRVIELCGKIVLYARDQDGRTPAELAHFHRAFEAAEYLNAIASPELDLREYPHQLLIESRTASLRSPIYHTSRGSLKLACLLVVAVVLLWYCNS